MELAVRIFFIRPCAMLHIGNVITGLHLFATYFSFMTRLIMFALIFIARFKNSKGDIDLFLFNTLKFSPPFTAPRAVDKVRS